MSALGHKRTSEGLAEMSALPPKADINAAVQYVRLVPRADIGPVTVATPYGSDSPPLKEPSIASRADFGGMPKHVVVDLAKPILCIGAGIEIMR